MNSENFIEKLPQDEKTKVAYALNLCAVSISQIIDSRDILVLKQERESILDNLNLQNFVKHPALFEILKQILGAVTYIEIQADDLSFIEKEYQQKLKNAVWSAIPSPTILLAGGDLSTVFRTVFSFPMKFTICTHLPKVCVKNRIQRTRFGQFPNAL